MGAEAQCSYNNCVYSRPINRAPLGHIYIRDSTASFSAIYFHEYFVNFDGDFGAFDESGS